MATKCAMSSLTWAAAVQQDQVSSASMALVNTINARLQSKGNIVMLHLQAPTSPASAESRLSSGVVLVTTLQQVSSAFVVLLPASRMNTAPVLFS